MEAVDIYDENRNETGRILMRGRDKLKPGEFIVSVDALIINSEGKILIGKRADTKNKFPGLWEINGGGKKAGETSEEAVVREVQEELGIDLDIKDAKLLKTVKNEFKFKDIWVFNVNLGIDELNFNDGEVSEARWVTYEEFANYREKEILIDFNNLSIEDYKNAKKMLGL